MIGSLMVSTMVLSTSVSSPTNTNRAFLFNFLLISRTTRFIFWNVADTGTIRRDMETSCSSSVSLRSWRADLVKVSSLSPFRSGEAVTMDSVMTISPTRAIKVSSLERLTEIKLSRACCWPGCSGLPDLAEDWLAEAPLASLWSSALGWGFGSSAFASSGAAASMAW